MHATKVFVVAAGYLVILAIGSLSVLVTDAQAAEFQIKGIKALKANLAGKSEGTISLLVPGRNLTLQCHHVEHETTSWLWGLYTNLVLKSLTCLTTSHTKGTALPCTVDNFVLTARGLPTIHSTKAYIRFEPVASENLTTVLLLGETCPLPEESPVKGSFAGQLTTNNSVTNLVTFSPTIETLLGSSLSFGGFSATFTGSETAELTGEHAGMAWGVA